MMGSEHHGRQPAKECRESPKASPNRPRPSGRGLLSLRQRVARLPDQPGVYFLKNRSGEIVYVGKALSLRKRVSSYFRHLPALAPRIARLMQEVVDLDIRQTASEAEALLMEARLIKQHRPRYNVVFRDDKAYPMLKVTNEPFPRLMVTRRRLSDGALYFGPYTEPQLMRQALRFMRRVFPLRTCANFPRTPCLEYHLGQCLAPCVKYITAGDYQRIVNDLVAFLRGQRDQLLQDLSRRMKQAARDQRFEEAARLRDQMQALTSVIVAKEKSLTAGPLEQLQAALALPRLPRRIEAFDISNIFGEFAVGSMVVFEDGKPLKAHYRRFKIRTVKGIDDYRMMQEVIRRRYGGSLASVHHAPSAEVRRRGVTDQLPWPDLILVDGGKGQLAAACAALRGPASASTTPTDDAPGSEAGRAEDSANVPRHVAGIPVIGLAKRFEHVFVPTSTRPIVLLPTSPVLHLVQRVRDEAHRFAIAYHRRLRRRPVTASVLDMVPGVGPERKRALLRRFGSLPAMARATAREVAQAGRLPITVAERIVQELAG